MRGSRCGSAVLGVVQGSRLLYLIPRQVQNCTTPGHRSGPNYATRPQLPKDKLDIVKQLFETCDEHYRQHQKRHSQGILCGICPGKTNTPSELWYYYELDMSI
ncbi:hypothetical protein INT44_001960 [Umbelopsis vinacea]|uniref:Uncharacterized protein n=1 Tax=Umbelopsis vinacea TaxID=44442 RepID=A0A8H7Q434_9FUNG|nr:hypothetical protein INT44_001960 [Umbelopsis vinacea]